MSSNIKADCDRIWQNSANWKYSPSQLREIDFRLHLVLLALEAIANLDSETIVIAAEELNVVSIIKDRLTLWESSSYLQHDANRDINTESIRSLILVVCYLANQHQELLRRSICLLEQVWEQDRSPDETTLLNNYKNRFISLYQTRIDPGCNSDDRLAYLAWKLANALLFYSSENGQSLLANAILDLVPTPFEYPTTKVSKRFTPPTCTLEITCSKPFFHSIARSKSKLQFELRFDDPREPTSDCRVIRGDMQDLEKLEIEIVRYVGQYLTSTFQLTDNTEPELSESSPDRPRLRKGLVDHELLFDRLTDNNLKGTILSTIQLFDLMTALEAFKTQVTQPNRTLLPKFFLWGGIAAVGIAAVAVAKILAPPPSQPNVASVEPSSPTQTKSETDEVLPPDLPQAIAEPDLNPQPNEPLTSAKRLPPPPAVDTPKPKPDIPDPADYPLPDVARQSGLNNAAPSVTTERQAESTVVIPDETKQANPNQAPVTTAIAPSTNPEPSELNIESNQSPPAASSDIALNSSPTATQIQQVTAYFQEQWQPPAELKQSLEYRLSLNADGSIARVSPLGKASALYLSQTNIPLDGEPFINATSESQPAVIRLLLSPDGRVKTFVE